MNIHKQAVTKEQTDRSEISMFMCVISFFLLPLRCFCFIFLQKSEMQINGKPTNGVGCFLRLDVQFKLKSNCQESFNFNLTQRCYYAAP